MGASLGPCDESRLQWEVEVCGEDFKKNMDHIDQQHWCNLTYFMKYVNSLVTVLCLMVETLFDLNMNKHESANSR